MTSRAAWLRSRGWHPNPPANARPVGWSRTGAMPWDEQLTEAAAARAQTLDDDTACDEDGNPSWRP